MDDKIKKFLLAAGVGLSFSVSAYLLYHLYKPEDEIPSLEYYKNKLTSRQSIIRLRVPKAAIGAIIGRQGVTVKDLQSRTNTRIKFEEPVNDNSYDDGDRILIIRGSPEDAQDAESLVHELINSQADQRVEEICVPSRVRGRIIGAHGTNIKHMTAISKAKITVDTSRFERDPDSNTKVTIKGTRDQIAAAVSLIKEKLDEDEMYRNTVSASTKKFPRYHHQLAIPFDNLNENLEQLRIFPEEEKIISHVPDAYCEIFVSAVHSPDLFWVQPIGTNSTALDKLVENMTTFYGDVYYQVIHMIELDEVKEGDLVAALMSADNCYYRAKVIKVQINKINPEESEIEVYFVDYGDVEVRKIEEIFKLKPEYRQLPLQAIRCSLAQVKPVGETWSAKAIDVFENLVHSARWIVLMVKAVGKNEENETIRLEIVDTNKDYDINVAEEMVKLKFAVWEEKQ